MTDSTSTAYSDVPSPADSWAPAPSAAAPREGRFGGVMIMPLVILVWNVVDLGRYLIGDMIPVFTQGYWSLLTTPGSPAFHAMWRPLLLWETGGSVALVALSVVGLLLYAMRSRYGPRLLAAYLLGQLAFNVVDYLMAREIPQLIEGTTAAGLQRQIAISAVLAVVFVPLFLFAPSVKERFRN